MLERIQTQTRICTKSQLQYLIKLLSSGVKSLIGLKSACNSSDYTFSRTFDDIIIFLEWLKVIRVFGEQIELLIDENLIFNSDNMISHLFFSKLFNKMNNQNILSEFLNNNNIKYISGENIVTINNNLIPFNFSQYRNLLIDFELFILDTIISNQFLINNYYKPWFVKEIIPLLENQNVSRKISLSNLKEIQRQNDAFGIEAERFVLAFEKNRLTGHIRFNDIQIISEDWSNAGYDIQSFNDKKSIIFDKFIEVKSYNIFPRFFWSANEVKVAEQKQNNYFLYLVDRNKINQNNYMPVIIKNPYVNVLLSDNWAKEVDKWFVKLKV